LVRSPPTSQALFVYRPSLTHEPNANACELLLGELLTLSLSTDPLAECQAVGD